MKQYEIINAYNALTSIAENQNINDDQQWELFKLRKFLRPHVEFQQEREKLISEKYEKFADEEGKISGKPYNDYLIELRDLGNMDIELDEFTKPVLSHKGINFLTMETLENFIEFQN